MSRCAYCRGFIWPWQRQGWRFGGRECRRWHAVCFAKANAGRLAEASIEDAA